MRPALAHHLGPVGIDIVQRDNSYEMAGFVDDWCPAHAALAQAFDGLGDRDWIGRHNIAYRQAKQVCTAIYLSANGVAVGDDPDRPQQLACRLGDDYSTYMTVSHAGAI